MKRLAFLALLASLAVVPSACLESEVSGPTASGAGGGLAFRLPAVLADSLSSRSDSMDVDLRHGALWKHQRVDLRGSVLVGDLAEGSWKVVVTVLDRQGNAWLQGTDSVQIVPGQVSDLFLVLRKATGSVQIQIQLDTLPIRPCPVVGPDTQFIDPGTIVPCTVVVDRDPKPAKILQFERTGGGSVSFQASLSSPDSVTAVVTSYDFKAASATIRIPLASLTARSRAVLLAALTSPKADLPIGSDTIPAPIPGLATGTWASLSEIIGDGSINGTVSESLFEATEELELIVQKTMR